MADKLCVSVLRDVDFLEGQSSGGYQPTLMKVSSSPGVSCGLFPKSICLFEQKMEFVTCPHDTCRSFRQGLLRTCRCSWYGTYPIIHRRKGATTSANIRAKLGSGLASRGSDKSHVAKPLPPTQNPSSNSRSLQQFWQNTFSSHSTGCFVEMRTPPKHPWQKVYVMKAKSVSAELTVEV